MIKAKTRHSTLRCIAKLFFQHPSRKWQSCCSTLWFISLKCGEHFCVANNPSDIPPAEMKTSYVHLPSASSQNQMCWGFDVDQTFFGSGKDEDSKLAHMKPQHTQHFWLSAQVSYKIVKNVNSLTFSGTLWSVMYKGGLVSTSAGVLVSCEW